jgi:hypothetical protein
MTSKKTKDEAWSAYQSIGQFLKDEEISYPPALLGMAGLMMDIAVKGLGKTEPDARSLCMTLFTPKAGDKN